MTITRKVMSIVSPAPVLTMLGVGALAGCGGDDSAGERASLGVAQSAFIWVPDDVLAMTLAPLRQLEETAGLVYFASIKETFPGSGSFVHSLHVYQPDATGEPISFELRATTASGTVDMSHTFEAVRLTTHPGQVDESEETRPNGSGQYTYSFGSSQEGWYRFDFEYHAPNAGRTLSIRALDGAGNPLKIAWCDPSGANVQVSATLAAEIASDVFFKGGAYRRAGPSDYATIDNVTLDEHLLYRRGFDQGPFDYPLGRLSAGEHTLRFSFTTSGTDPSYLWFGVNEDSFDTINAKTEWDRTQLLYRGSMRTGDYDAYNEGIAFAQGPALAHGVRPPPVRRGTTFAVALEDPGLNGPWANATLQIHAHGSGTLLGWPAWRSTAGDYRGGIMTASGFSARYREHWLVSVPADAPVGRYVLRATAPNGVQIGSEVLLYVIHNPYPLVGSGLTKQEVETFAYDEDEDGMTLGGQYGPDQDSARDHFTALYSDADSGYSVESKLSAAFRRTQAADSYSMLDYAMAAVDGTASEFESMRRLYRVVSQRVRYTRPALNGDSSYTFFGPGDGTDFGPDEAQVVSQPGTELEFRVGGECYDYSTILTALARTSGIVSRTISAPAAGLGGWSPHYFAEAYIPDLPHHGGRTTASGEIASDTDHWYVFDATDPKGYGTESDFSPPWTVYGEAIAPRAQYGRARIATASPLPPPWHVFTTRLDWDPLFDGTLFEDDMLSVADAYSSGPEYWLTESGVTGWIGYGEKDIYRISRETTGASVVRVNALPSGGAGLSPALCLASATAPAPFIPEQCASPASSVELPPGESYVVVFNIEPDPQDPDYPDPAPGRLLRGDTMQYELVLETACNEATAVDMGVPGTAVTVPNNGCLKVTQYPAWWGTRQMQLQNMSPGSYPVPFSYTNCGTTQGSGTIPADWQSFFFNGINDDCTTLIDLNGAGDGNVTLRYYAM